MNDFLVALKRFSKSLFPNRCEFCGEVIEFKETVCEECKNLPEIDLPACPYCGASKEDCNCNKRKNEYKAIVAPYYYKDNVVSAVHRFKDSYMVFLSKRFSRDIAKSVCDSLSDVTFDAVTYVPMTKKAVRKREYNQSMLLAKEVSRLIDVPLYNLLIKTEETKPQKKQSARQRKVNLYGVFDVTDKEFVKDKTDR
ncbi:MAG: ComF family protein, partial [Eubacterium sp.]